MTNYLLKTRPCPCGCGSYEGCISPDNEEDEEDIRDDDQAHQGKEQQR